MVDSGKMRFMERKTGRRYITVSPEAYEHLEQAIARTRARWSLKDAASQILAWLNAQHEDVVDRIVREGSEHDDRVLEALQEHPPSEQGGGGDAGPAEGPRGPVGEGPGAGSAGKKKRRPAAERDPTRGKRKTRGEE